MTVIERKQYLLVVFPDASEPREFAKVAAKLMTSLQQATGTAPALVHPNTSAICLLIEGLISRIEPALEDSCRNCPRLLTEFGEEFSFVGLNAAKGWLQSRRGGR